MSIDIKQEEEDKRLYYLIENALFSIGGKELNQIVVDLTSNQRYFAFLELLFSFNAGEWLDLESLCDDYEHITTRFQTLRKINALTMPIDVTWLDYSHHREGFCLIVIYCEHPIQNVIYNRSRFLEERAKRDSD